MTVLRDVSRALTTEEIHVYAPSGTDEVLHERNVILTYTTAQRWLQSDVRGQTVIHQLMLLDKLILRFL